MGVVGGELVFIENQLETVQSVLRGFSQTADGRTALEIGDEVGTGAFAEETLTSTHLGVLQLLFSENCQQGLVATNR